MQKIRIKKAIAMIMAVVMLISASLFAVSAANPEELGRLPIRAIFEESGAVVDWCEDDRTIHIELVGNTFVLHTHQPLAYVNDEVRPLQDGIILWEGRSFISFDDLEIVMDGFTPVFADDDAVILIVTGRYGQGTPEVNEMVASILGTENTQERFNIYFNWFNTVHEIGHIVDVVLHDGERETDFMRSELFANAFAAAFWERYGDEETFNMLREIISHAVENLDSPLAEGEDIYDFARLWEAGELDFTFEIYGWFQFNVVDRVLNEMQDLESLLLYAGLEFSEAPPERTLTFDSLGEDSIPEILAAVFTVLQEWGIEMPFPVYHMLDDDPHMHMVILGLPFELIEAAGFPADGAVRVWTPTAVSISLDEAEEIATAFMEKFVEGDIAETIQMMTAELQAAFAEWEFIGTTGFEVIRLIALVQRGSFVDWNLVAYQEVQGLMVFDFAVNNVIGIGGYRVVVDSDGKITGFTDLGFVFEPIPAAEDAAYTVYPIIIGEGTVWELDGLLTMPNEASVENPVPAVVLVHGSGPQNMDTSVFDNRPFHDIATYLSSNGIAVIRYHKRTLTHGMALMQTYGDNLTVWEETVEDALLAAEILRADPRVSSVFVAGNSLGGMLAPRIAEEGELDGAILLGASPRPLFEVSYDQNIQHFNNLLLAGEMSQEEVDEWSVIVADLLEEARNLPNLTEEEMQGMLVFGIPAIWQRSLYDSLPLPIISRNIIPTFILHGDRDFQVWTESDFNVFVEHIEDYAHVTARLYDNVNHIFMQSQTDYNDLREYMVLGNVDRQVLRDMVEWIMNNK